MRNIIARVRETVLLQTVLFSFGAKCQKTPPLTRVMAMTVSTVYLCDALLVSSRKSSTDHSTHPLIVVCLCVSVCVVYKYVCMCVYVYQVAALLFETRMPATP